jgi:succinate dehydrogenase / fumarate reductase cytochrome b subunit
MKLAYYPGCSAQSTCRELDASTRRVAAKLGLELVGLESPTCTGSRQVRAINRDLFLALNARLLAQAESLGLPLMTVCNTCTLNLLDTEAALRDEPETRARVDAALDALGLRYRGEAEVTHFLWVLMDKVGEERLRRAIVRPLTGLRVAAFYGCHLVRPGKHYGNVDSRNARSIERLAALLGCEPIDYTGRTECCGFHTMAHNERVAVKLSGMHLNAAKAAGAAAIVTPCPLCHTVLDTLQPAMEAATRTHIGLPVLHLSQLLGLALGMGEDELQLDRHMVRADRLL